MGWYHSPDNRDFWRWWDGSEWTYFLCPAEKAPPGDALIPPTEVPRPDSAVLAVEAEQAAQPVVPEPLPAHSAPVAPPRPDPHDLRNRVPAHALLEKLTGFVATGELRLDPDPRWSFISEDARSWYVGALGERRVAAELSALPPEWTVLHSVPVGRGTSDIDHVAIGPAGVFTINSKHHAGASAWVGDHAMYVGGARVDYLRAASYEARRASSMLSHASGLTVPVTGLITLVGARRLNVKQRPAAEMHVDVVRLEHLLQRIQTRREFSDEQVARIASAACRFGTWHTGRPNAVDISPALAQLELASAPRAVQTATSPRTRRRGGFRRFAVGCLAVIGAVMTGLMAISFVGYLFTR